MSGPRITDEMVDRYLASMKSNDWTTREGVRTNLEAALDRRTGDKCRRVEKDDLSWSWWDYGRRRPEKTGRRKDDIRYWRNLPAKSSRLAREAAEKAKAEPEEIPVSEGMRRAGWLRYLNARGVIAADAMNITDEYAMQESYRAMERARREELKGKPSPGLDPMRRPQPWGY